MANKWPFSAVEATIAALLEERARGDAFEHAVAHYLRSDPERGMRQVWSWDDWPGRIANHLPGTDLGIDLVAEDEVGAVVGVQVKHRLDPGQAIRWVDVATALGYRPDLFARRLIVTNAYDRTANTRRATETTANVGWVLRDDLLASPIDWAGALEAGSGPATPTTIKFAPRPYQAAAVRDVVSALGTNERAQLVMACGTGKTLVTLWVAEARQDERVLVLVPTLLLLKQFRHEWRTHAQLPFVDLAVCSDADTVGRDEWRVRADELGVPVTTEPAAIAAFLRGPGRRVVFGTYASSARIAEAQARRGVPAFDLVVADEAHRIAGIVQTRMPVERDQRVVLYASKLRAKRRLFTTATPRVYTSATRGRLANLGDIELASMDDPALFGPVAHQLWFREAVDLGVLVDYELVAVLVTDAEVAEQIRERSGVVVEGGVLDAETLATLVSIRRGINDLSLTRTITFHHTIARARRFATALESTELEGVPPRAEHISGDLPVRDRERVLQALKAPVRPTVVTNARCLTEGIDVPSLDAVAFVDPRASQVDIVQAVGRVMRRAAEKARGHVVVPVFLREADLADPEAAVAGSAFAKVLDVLRALRAHDPDLTIDASRVKSSLGPRTAVVGGHIASHLRLLGAGFDPSRFEEALEMRFVEVAAQPFDVGIAVLRKYADREGHTQVPATYREEGFRLGVWVRHYRTEGRTGRLDPARVAQLDAFPSWSWDPFADDWAVGLRALSQFASREGHTVVPALHREGGFRLGQWVLNRRQERRRGRLAPTRAARLETFPGWSWDTLKDQWIASISAIRAFAEREGHTRVPVTHREGTLNLGLWVSTQRSKHRFGRLDPARVAELEAIPGWSWDTITDSVWQANFAALRAFIAREGHAEVPVRYSEDGVALGTWVSRQRYARRRGRMAPARVAELESLPGWTWGHGRRVRLAEP
jgi:superfamily II DNA or RNA helicase